MNTYWIRNHLDPEVICKFKIVGDKTSNVNVLMKVSRKVLEMISFILKAFILKNYFIVFYFEIRIQYHIYVLNCLIRGGK